MNWFKTQDTKTEELSEIEQLMEVDFQEESRKQKVQNFIQDKIVEHFRSNQEEWKEFKNFTKMNFTQRLLDKYAVRVPTAEPFLLAMHLSIEYLKDDKVKIASPADIKKRLIAQIESINTAPSLKTLANIMHTTYLLKMSYVEKVHQNMFLSKFIEELGIHTIPQEEGDDKPIPKSKHRNRNRNKNKQQASATTVAVPQ